MLDGLGALADPVRRRRQEHLAAEDQPVPRVEVAEATGVSRTLAAYHLDRLTAGDLLPRWLRAPQRTDRTRSRLPARPPARPSAKHCTGSWTS